MLRKNISYTSRREEIANAKARAVADMGNYGPHFLLLEEEVRACVNRLLQSVPIVRAVRHSIWISPATCSLLLHAVFARPTAHSLICIGADAAQTSVACRFDDDDPKIRLDSVCLVNVLRPAEQDNRSLVYLGATMSETKDAIERVVQETHFERIAASLSLKTYLLMDSGGILKWLKRRGVCALDGIAKVHLATDVMTTMKPCVKATSESLNLGIAVDPTHIVPGLLHGLCTIIWRLYKKGLVEADQAVLDAYFVRVTGNALGRPCAGGADAKKGKLEIEKLDAVLRRVDELLLHVPPRWHETIRCVHRLRWRRRDLRGLQVLGIIHQAFIANTADGWSLGCHLVAHTVDFAIRFAEGDLWTAHEQLVERANQLFKLKTRFWSGDAARVLASHNCQHIA